jgi:excisionase family DNA binding protein
MTGADKLLTPPEVARRLQVPEETLSKWRVRGKGPAFHRMGRHVRYDPRDLEAWLKSCKTKPGVVGGEAA